MNLKNIGMKRNKKAIKKKNNEKKKITILFLFLFKKKNVFQLISNYFKYLQILIKIIRNKWLNWIILQ